MQQSAACIIVCIPELKRSFQEEDYNLVCEKLHREYHWMKFAFSFWILMLLGHEDH